MYYCLGNTVPVGHICSNCLMNALTRLDDEVQMTFSVLPCAAERVQLKLPLKTQVLSKIATFKCIKVGDESYRTGIPRFASF